MTATDELRRLLDECGVKYRDYCHADKTWWGGRENVGWYAENRPSASGLYVKIEAVLTPEQAIAATLGAGTCKAVYSPNGVYCSVCHGGGLTIPRRGVNTLRNFCPNCGRKVVDE